MCIYITTSQAQKKFDEEAEIAKIEAMYKDVLIHSKAHDWLHYLCKDIGGRLGGSPEYSAAVQYTSHMLDSIGVDSVWTQEVMVPYWRRGDVEKAKVVQSSVGEIDLSVAALGFSGGTTELGLVGEIVEVRSFEELDSLGEKGLSGKIVFFNREMDRTRLNTFYAYGAAVNQLTYAVDNLSNVKVNSEAARSRILDTDYAQETSELARTQIIQQAGTAMLAQANQLPQTVLSLLQ